MIDVSGDGDDNQGVPTLHSVRDALLAKDVVINGLPIIVKPPDYIYPPQPPEGLDVYYRQHVVGGEGHVPHRVDRLPQFPRGYPAEARAGDRVKGSGRHEEMSCIERQDGPSARQCRIGDLNLRHNVP